MRVLFFLDEARTARRMQAEVVSVPATWELAADRLPGWVYLPQRSRRLWRQPGPEPGAFRQVSPLTGTPR
jgi:hypothetical protein